MNWISRTQMQTRLRSALSHEIGVATRATHLASLESALSTLPVPAAPLSRQRAPRLRTATLRWAAGLAAAVVTLAPVGVAVAAEDALPGDPLYQAKLVAESVRSLVDPLVAARHRIEELEELIEEGADPATIGSALNRASESVGALDMDHPLVGRLEVLLGRIVGLPGDEPPPLDSPDPGMVPPPLPDFEHDIGVGEEEVTSDDDDSADDDSADDHSGGDAGSSADDSS